MTSTAPARGHARTALLDAAVQVIRAQGLHATTVDDLCAAAGVTKGAFFHHFDSKEALAVAAAEHWSATTGSLFDAAPYHDHADPVDRIRAYVDFRASLIAGSAAEYSCLVGTMTQEAFATNPTIRDACAASILGHAETLEHDFALALARRPDLTDVTAASLARYTQVVLQGSFIVAKAMDDPAVVLDGIAHLRRYLDLLFPRTPHST